jgi:hypothetical protein|nr:MAG TPA: hypothetical protein [Caudoviricetes sp.]
MFIINGKDLKNGKRFNKNQADWLIENGFCLLSVVDGEYIFSDTEELRNILSFMPKELRGE